MTTNEQLRVANWDRWQTYRKDRGPPPWIKIHLTLFANPEWAELSDAEKGQLLSIWMIAAKRDGNIPANGKLVRKMAQLDDEPDLNKFKELGFLATSWQPDDNQMATSCPASGNQVVALELDTDKEKEKKNKTKRKEKEKPKPATKRQPDDNQAPDEEQVIAPASGADQGAHQEKPAPKKKPTTEEQLVAIPGIHYPAWESYVKHRRKIKARKLQPASAIRQATWLANQGSADVQTEIVNTTVRNGWTGLFDLKGGKHEKPNGIPLPTRKSASEKFAENLFGPIPTQPQDHTDMGVVSDQAPAEVDQPMDGPQDAGDGPSGMGASPDALHDGGNSGGHTQVGGAVAATAAGADAAAQAAARARVASRISEASKATTK